MVKKVVKVKNGGKGIAVKLVSLIIIGFLTQFFIVEAYDSSLVIALILTIIFVLLSLYYWEKGFFNFLLFALITICTFISLEVSFNLGLYLNFIFSFILGLIFSFIYIKYKKNEIYDWLLLVGFVIVWSILAFNVLYRHDWILENVLNVPFVVIVLIIAKWFRFSKLSYSLMFIFMFMNVVGSHYTYSEVPFGFWLEGFLGLQRNHYDRIVHFLFGFLFAYPLREVYIRMGNYKGIWALLAPVTMVFGLSAIYELLEWGIAVIFGGDLGIAYLGSQGDIWDAQKDMFLAGMGSIIAMAVTFLVIMGNKGKAYLNELKESFKVHRAELGEVALAKMR